MTIMKIMTTMFGTSVHEVKDEAEFVWGVEGVRHADDERTI